MINTRIDILFILVYKRCKHRDRISVRVAFSLVNVHAFIFRNSIVVAVS